MLISKKNYKLIAIDLSKQTELKDPQQINFIGKLSRRSGATIFFIIEKLEETTFNFSQNSVTIVSIMETQKIINLLNGSENGILLTVNQMVIIQKIKK